MGTKHHRTKTTIRKRQTRIKMTIETSVLSMALNNAIVGSLLSVSKVRNVRALSKSLHLRER